MKAPAIHIKRRQTLKQIGGLALGSTFFSSLADKLEKLDSSFPKVITNRVLEKPNILWITSEGTPISVLNFYQDSPWGDLRANLVDMPNIGRIAHDGLRFENAFCTNTLCAPSRATLLAGKYNHENGVTSNTNATPGGAQECNNFDIFQETFPKILRHGYQTAMMGKWNLRQAGGKSANPSKARFDKFALKRGVGGPYYNPNSYLENPHTGCTIIQCKSY